MRSIMPTFLVEASIASPGSMEINPIRVKQMPKNIFINFISYPPCIIILIAIQLILFHIPKCGIADQRYNHLPWLLG